MGRAEQCHPADPLPQWAQAGIGPGGGLAGVDITGMGHDQGPWCRSGFFRDLVQQSGHMLLQARGIVLVKEPRYGRRANRHGTTILSMGHIVINHT